MRVISREFLRGGGLSETLAGAERAGLLRLLTQEERDRSRRDTLARARWRGEDVWVFGYGSLMWNPAFHYAERCFGRVYGYHRSFCLYTPVGRGTPERPGLVLGLDRGGSCHGVLFRIEGAKVQEELGIIWSREMVAGSYLPTWIMARADDAAVPAIAFVIDRGRPNYAGRLDADQVAQRIATAAGALGPCADYLEETVAHLEEAGIHDRTLHSIRAQVRRLQSRAQAPNHD
ncbi:MAG: gamma-glutamylcyclotransferase [Burkholderiales bacterium]|nr:MAG: gamma-glutamylcyclotransferase [Burkholderiales bacterium]